jgi:hypothetical protein
MPFAVIAPHSSVVFGPKGQKAQRVPDRMWDELKEFAELFGEHEAKVLWQRE